MDDAGNGDRRCAACGRPQAACASAWCRRADRGWVWVSAAGPYEGTLRASLLAYKLGGERWRAGPLGGLLARQLVEHAPWWEEFDTLVPVPAFTGPGARRGWQPVAGLAEVAAARAGPGWDLLGDAVVKSAETAPLAGLGAPGRRRAADHLGGLLVVARPERVRGRRVVVVDDVFTEGSTLRAVATALRRAGAAEVAGLVVAAAEWRRPAGGRCRAGR